MTFQEWRPQTPRNRIALYIAFFSLLLTIAWHFTPVYRYEGKEMIFERITVINPWPGIFRSIIYNFDPFTPNNIPSLCVTFCFVFLVAMQCVLIPFWRIFSQSKLLRSIPLVIFLIGSTICLYYFSTVYMISYNNFPIYPITLNFLATSIALILLKNEARQAFVPHR